MTKSQLYKSLEIMIDAAERGDREAVGKTNKDFSHLLYDTYRHLPNWSMNEETLLYDRCANSAVYSVGDWIGREEHLTRMRERFSKIPKP